MIAPRKRLSAPRVTVQLLVAWACVSAIGGGCSSGVKTVSVDCPVGGATSAGGDTSAATGGSDQPSSGATEAAGEAGTPGSDPDAAQGGSLGGGGSGHAGVGGHSGNSARGGHGGTGGSTGTGGSGGSSGGQAVCGDKAVTAPEFCDDGTNTDLSYGCYACTTLPAGSLGSGGTGGGGGAAKAPPQCDTCLNQTPTKACFECQDYRACYACLRQQPSDFSDMYCVGDGLNDDGAADDGERHQALSDACFNPKDPYGSAQVGGPAGKASRGSVCQALIACVLRTGCAKADSPVARFVNLSNDCYRGSAGADLSKPAAGPCAREYRNLGAVPAGYDPMDEFSYLGRAWVDLTPDGSTAYIVAVANQLLACAGDGCASVCYPNGAGTASGGTGGVGGTGGGIGGTGGHGGSGGLGGHSGGP